MYGVFAFASWLAPAVVLRYKLVIIINIFTIVIIIVIIHIFIINIFIINIFINLGSRRA